MANPNKTNKNASLTASSEEMHLANALRQDARAVAELCRLYGDRIYRYQLALCGDYLQAQELTYETLLTALDWIANFEPQRSSLLSWLLSIAQYKRLYYRRGGKRSLKWGDEGPYDIYSEAAQAQAMQRAQMAQLASQLRKARRWQAEAIALNYFAGLAWREVSQLLHRAVSPANLAAIDQIGPTSELSSLAQEIHLDAKVMAWLVAGLQEYVKWHSPVKHNRFSSFIWKTALRMRANPGRAVQGVALFIILAGMLYYLAIQQAAIYKLPPQPLSVLPAPRVISARYLPNNVLTDSPGYLVPPDRSVCEEWRSILNQTLGVPVTLDTSAPFPFRALIEPDAVGSGCKLRASGANGKFQGTSEILERIAKRLIDDRFIYYGEFILERGRANEYVYGDDGYGKGLLFRKINSGAILSVSWMPNDPALCQEVESEANCNLPNEDKIYTVVLGMGENPVYQDFNTFLANWGNGTSKALNYLDDTLQRRISNLGLLDKLAGIDRSSAGKVQFYKRVVDNNGSQILVTVQAYRLDEKNQASNAEPVVYMILANTNGKWRIVEISRDAGFAPTSDHVILADAGGRVYLASVSGSWQSDISDRGVYTASPVDQNAPISQPPRISPDGNWLSLPQLSDTGTWLLSMNKRISELLISHAQGLAWSPDSQKIAYVYNPGFNVIYTRTVPYGKENELATVDGRVLSLAWSPSGNSIAVEYTQAVYSSRRTVALVSLSTGSVRSLYSSFGQFGKPSTFDMLWTPDGSELWYVPSQSVIRISDGEVRPLVGEPGNVPASSLQLGRLHSPIINNGEPVLSALSADGKQMAFGYYNETRSAIDTLMVQPASELATIEMVEQIGPMSAMAWTREGYNLIIAENADGPGTIWRVSPFSEGIKSIAGKAYLIGVTSQLQNNSLNLTPPSTASLIAQSQQATTWQVQKQPGQSVEFQYPAGWKVWTVGRGDQTQITISNVEFGQSYDWISLNNDTLFVQIAKAPFQAAVTLKSWQTYITLQNKERLLWQPVLIGGRQGYLSLAQSSAENGEVYAFPEEDGIIWVTKKPGDSSYNQIFEEILRRLKF